MFAGCGDRMYLASGLLWWLHFGLQSSLFLLAFANAGTHPRYCGGAMRHVHVAVGADPSTSMTVSFASIPCKFKPPYAGVAVGRSPSQLSHLFLEDRSNSPTSYNLTVTNGANYGKHSYFAPYYHHVPLVGLQPDEVYYYQPILKASLEDFDGLVERANRQLRYNQTHRSLQRSGPYDGSNKDCPAMNKIRSFRTAPLSKTVTIAVMGDLGQFPHSEETVSRMLRSVDDFQLAILAGDIAYSGYDHRRWDTFFDFLDDYPLAERVPLMVCPGNHDIDKQDDGNDLFLAYENRFRMPWVHPPELGVYEGPLGRMNMDHPPYPLPYEWGNGYYAYTYGGARIIMLNVYASMDPGSLQYMWFEDELKAANDNRGEAPWVVVVMHTPIYNTFALHLHDVQIFAARSHLEPLMVDYRVNLVFSGHIHAYQRTHPVRHNETDPRGPMHITVGAGGRQCNAPFKTASAEDWVAVRDATFYGYGMLRIHNDTIAEWDWVHSGYTDDRDYNEVKGSSEHLPGGPGRDHIYLENQFFL